MNCTMRRFVIAVACAVLAVTLLAPGEARVEARGSGVPLYCSDGSQVFWFVHASDTHIGTTGSTDTDNLSWLVTTGRNTIKPAFTVVTGDLTDSTNGNIFGYPNGPYQAEWDRYKSTLSAGGITRGSSVYYDLPGNHDAYNDRLFAYYRANAIQGGNYTPGGQLSWTLPLSFGTYHFVGVNTADNTGDSFSLLPPYGDYAGLDSSELTALSSDLAANANASATFVFGHHPVTGTGDSADTYLYYGASQFVSALDVNDVKAYNYGHAHDNVETIFTGAGNTGSISPGLRYARVASLGKDGPNSYSVVSVDCNGVNSVTQTAGTWPVVLITAPVNRYVGGASNPFAYSVPTASSNPIRALVFDPAAVTQVRFRVDGAATWTEMTRAGASSPQWSGTWDAASTTAAEHTIEVQATGTATRSHVIKVNVTGGSVNRPPVAAPDAYSTTSGRALTVAAPGVLANDTDADGNPLTASLVSQAAHGTATLAANGGFTYAPAAGYSGSDAFAYLATDTAGVSSDAVTVTITIAPAATDTVAITSATYTRKSKTLAVKATSSAAGSVTLRITSPVDQPMAYSTKTRVYSFQGIVSTQPSSVTVTSSGGGAATKQVTIK